MSLDKADNPLQPVNQHSALVGPGCPHMVACTAARTGVDMMRSGGPEMLKGSTRTLRPLEGGGLSLPPDGRSRAQAAAEH